VVANANIQSVMIIETVAVWLSLLFQWPVQSSGSISSLRGISAVDEQVAWASGARGTVLRTLDGGNTWTARPVPDAGTLDFRDIEAFDRDRAIIMSAGPGALSRTYETNDGGEHWTLLFQNRQEKGFFDAIAFWNRKQGLILGDAVDGRMVVLRTSDGGANWQPVDPKDMPAAQEGEGAFAASGTALVVRPGGRAWFATGGTGGARVFRSRDWGRSWHVSTTPLRHDGPGSGIFSLAFWDDAHGVAVGGNYTLPAEDKDNVALTRDGGRTWTASSKSRPAGYRSAVMTLDKSSAIATGAGGTDVSRDGGLTWSPCGAAGYHALSGIWAVGDKGIIAKRSRSGVCP
jgi:photosystem II stability/assembly factor-like uncharacterized protein